MPHVDDGTLHAYLDGALIALAEAGALQDGASATDVEVHIRDCADCRERLDAERAVRAQAGDVLNDARPALMDVPPFDLIAPVAPPRRRSTLQYAWAASVLLALGAGWMGGELLRSGADSFEQASHMESMDVAPMSSAAEPRQDEMTTTAPQQEVLATAEPRQDAVASAEPATRAGSTAVADSPVTSVARQAVEPMGQTVRAADVEVLRAVDPSPLATLGQRSARATVPAPVPPAAPAAMALQPPAVQALVATEAAALGGAAQVAAVAQFRAHLQRARAGDLTWLPLSADDQRRREAAVLVVQGAGTPQVDAAVAAPGTLLRVRQRLLSGDEVQLLLWSPPVVTADAIVTPGAPLRVAPLRPPGEAAVAREEARVRTPPIELQESRPADGVHELILYDSATGTYVALSGALPPAQLRQLVARLLEPY